MVRVRQRRAWPLCHCTLVAPSFEPAHFAWYEIVNRRFADVVAAEATVSAPQCSCTITISHFCPPRFAASCRSLASPRSGTFPGRPDGYFRGVAIDGVIIGALTWIALFALGRPFSAPLAALAAIGELVPYVGPLVAAVPAVALALLDSPQQALLVAGVYVVIQQIEGHVVTPLVMYAQTDITPATVLIAVISGWAIAGVLGAIAAVPLFAAVRVLVLHVVVPHARCAEMRQLRRQRATGARDAE